MGERLQWFKDPPTSWLHWEPVLGGLQAHRWLLDRWPKAGCQIAAHDISRALEAAQSPNRRTWNPLSWSRSAGVAVDDGQPVGMVWANMALHQVSRPQALLRQWQQRLQTNGFLMFSCLGPDSLRELRMLYLNHGWHEPSHAFTDMHDWGDMLVQAGFAEPVMDMERITLAYTGAGALLEELRSLGRNFNAMRSPSLRGRQWRRDLEQAIEQELPRTDDGRLKLTFEIVYGHAFKAVPRPPRPENHAVSLDDMRSMLRDRRA